MIRHNAWEHEESSALSWDSYDSSLDTMLAQIVAMLEQLGIDKISSAMKSFRWAWDMTGNASEARIRGMGTGTGKITCDGSEEG